MTSNQEPHVIYQPAYAPGYPTGAPISVWNQPPSQAVTYIPYTQTDMGTYADKASYGGYPPLAYQAHDNGEMMRQHHYQNQHYAQPAQWQYQQGQSHYIPTYATTFNAATDPAYQGAPPPNMNRPPPNVKRDDFQGAIGMMENPAQSAAAYTASWVSSTSSIPPEMRDEPEASEENSGNYEGRNSGQWPGLNEENRPKTDKSGAKKTEKRDEPRELTFDERLEKARMQKDRVENQGFENTSANASAAPPPVQGAAPRTAQNTGAPNASGGNGSRPESSRGGGSGGAGVPNTYVGRGAPRGGQQMNGGDRRNNYRNDLPREGEFRQDAGYSGGYQGRGGKRGGGAGNSNNNMGGNVGGPSYPMGMMHSGMPMQYAQAPMYAPQNAQYVLASPMTQAVDPQLIANIAALQNTHLSYSPMRRYLLPGPFGMMPAPIQQDAKFRNTWLDAQSYPPFGAMLGFDSRGRGGYRGRGGRGGYRGGRGGGQQRYERRDDRRDDRETRAPTNGEQKEKPNEATSTEKVENVETVENVEKTEEENSSAATPEEASSVEAPVVPKEETKKSDVKEKTPDVNTETSAESTEPEQKTDENEKNETEEEEVPAS